ncbi:septum formation family protein [Corynebacterium lubricantis]|uniref:septum formation family protein n=1 Tax=Corynebacterium lubricantis TaxID=541095 RepID=UPI0003A6F717|nr:septum formation family protein [Corynebacterium lubricantis]
MASRSTWRTGTGVRTLLLAALSGTVAIGSYTLVAEGGVGSGTTAESGTESSVSSEPVAPFTTADQGACLTWQVDDQGGVTSFEQTDCNSEHRFEISARENLATYPTSEFGADAELPNQTRQAQLREELCQSPTVRYLDGQYDPYGKYSIAPILPSAESWAGGDRTMLCGLQVTDEKGVPQPTTGRAADQDQARVAEPGQCMRVDSSSVLHTVPCKDDHHIEVTLKEDLAPVFPDSTPSTRQQDDHLREVCTQAAMDYLGGEEQLYQSTLQPYWGSLPTESWDGGSRTVNCGLVFGNEEDSFATLKGSARDGREGFTIDGEPPAEQPDREPIRRGPSAEAPAGQEQSGAAVTPEAPAQ